MTRRHVCMLVGLSLVALVATPALSCTTVCLLEKEKAEVRPFGGKPSSLVMAIPCRVFRGRAGVR